MHILLLLLLLLLCFNFCNSKAALSSTQHWVHRFCFQFGLHKELGKGDRLYALCWSDCRRFESVSAMRYQGINSDILHHHPSNGKKPIVKICSKDTNLDNGGRHMSRGSLEGAKVTLNVSGLGLKEGGSSSSTMRSPDKSIAVVRDHEHENRNENENVVPESFEKSMEGNPPPRPLKEGRDDMLFQWSKKKRPRGYRPESRNVREDSPMPPRKTLRIDRHTARPEKQKVLAESQPIVPPRSMTLRACTPLREAHYASIKSYAGHSEYINNGPSQRVDMHSSATQDRHDRAVTCFGANTFGTTTDCMVRNSTPSDTDAHAPPEKVNMETFEWPRILLALSRKEKEDDFLVMKGNKLPQRPKKRPKNVEKIIQNCFPGNWLSDLAKGRYEVREKKCIKKKPRGLKAMESSDSDSD